MTLGHYCSYPIACDISAVYLALFSEEERLPMDDDDDKHVEGEENQGMEESKPEKGEENGDKTSSNDADAQVTEEVEDNVPLLTKFGFDEVARLAEAEFQRRQGLAEGSLDELVLRPWGFPKGGFLHQVLRIASDHWHRDLHQKPHFRMS